MSGQTMVRLRDLGKWSGGNTPSKANPVYWENGTVPWVSPKDMKVDEITSSEDHITETALKDRRVTLVPAGSVLFVTRSGILAHTFPVATTKIPVTINQDLKALTPKPGISPKYVAHAVRESSRRILKQCSKHGTTVASIETNALLDFEIPLVSLANQNRIVAELELTFSRLDEAVAELMRVKANLKRYKIALISAAVDGRLLNADRNGECAISQADPDSRLPKAWRLVPIGKLASLIDYGTSSKATAVLPGGVPVLRMGNIVDGEIDREVLKYLPVDHPEFPRLLLQPGDLLFNRTNSPEHVGKAAVFKGSPSRCSFASYLIRVRLLSDCMPEFAAAFINSRYGRNWVKMVATQQVGQANVNGTKLKELCVPLPPPEHQRRITEELSKRMSVVSALRSTVDGQLMRACALRARVLARALQV